MIPCRSKTELCRLDGTHPAEGEILKDGVPISTPLYVCGRRGELVQGPYSFVRFEDKPGRVLTSFGEFRHRIQEWHEEMLNDPTWVIRSVVLQNEVWTMFCMMWVCVAYAALVGKDD